MNLSENVNNGVNGTGVLNEGVSPGWDNVGQQALPDRNKWTKQENIDIMECYCRSKPINENGVPIRGYHKRMYREWQDRGLFKATEQRICNQARAIGKNGWLSEVELEAIRKKVLMEMEDRERTEGKTDDNEQREQVENQTEGQMEEKMVDGYIDVEEGETLLDKNNDLNEEEHEILTQIMEIMKGKKFGGQSGQKNGQK